MPKQTSNANEGNNAPPVVCRRCGEKAEWYDSFLREVVDLTSPKMETYNYWVDIFKCRACGQRQAFRRPNGVNQIGERGG